MKLNDLKNKNIHIVGLSGTEGGSIALFLLSLGCKNITGHDFKDQKDFAHSFFDYRENAKTVDKEKSLKKILTGLKKINYRENYLQGISEAEIVFVPSSWFRYSESKELFALEKKAKLGKIKFWNWYNLFLEFFNGTIIGVTGTAGKGTVTNLLYQLLKPLKKSKCFLIGDSWCTYDFKKMFSAGKDAIVVAEINNRTLKFADFSQKSPKISVITNVFLNHLDDHNNSFKDYLKTKLNIYKQQKRGDKLFINSEDPVLKSVKHPKQTIFYSTTDKERGLIPQVSYFSSKHLQSDAISAIKIAKLFKISDDKITKIIKNFGGRVGRMQTLGKKRGITFINDGAATRPEAAAASLTDLPNGKVILILEGSRKFWLPKEFNNLITNIKIKQVKKVFISGPIAGLLTPLLKKAGIKVEKTLSLENSFKLALATAIKDDVILLSPACESFGEFKDYRERSAKFTSLFKSL
jgi:UDP-N-acetylmuramoylalanine--D-glutamate ligase